MDYRRDPARRDVLSRADKTIGHVVSGEKRVKYSLLRVRETDLNVIRSGGFRRCSRASGRLHIFHVSVEARVHVSGESGAGPPFDITTSTAIIIIITVFMRYFRNEILKEKKRTSCPRGHSRPRVADDFPARRVRRGFFDKTDETRKNDTENYTPNVNYPRRETRRRRRKKIR